MLQRMLRLAQSAKKNMPSTYRYAVMTLPRPVRQRMYDTYFEKTIDPVTDVRGIFETIYDNNLWNSVESRSGYGSELASTNSVRLGLQNWLERHHAEISTFLDAPCGDFNWMRTIKFPHNIRYIGGEIVRSLVNENAKNYQDDRRSFIELDIIEGLLPHTDAWLCRDALIHFPFSAGTAVVEKFRQSSCKYFISTTYPSADNAVDINFGRFHPVNLTIAPFNLGEPHELIRDARDEKAEQILGIWKNPNHRGL
jgi:hypothetical protein